MPNRSPATELIAHRGASAHAPENTMAAFDLAWHHGADAIETDLHLTADRIPVAIHDADGRRTLGCEKRIDAMSLDEISALDAGSWMHPRFSAERVPTLDAVLARLPADKSIVLELKSPDPLPRLAAEIINLSGIDPRRITVISFDPNMAAAFKWLVPYSPCLWLVEPAPNLPHVRQLIETIERLGLDGVDLAADLASRRGFPESFIQKNHRVLTYTVNDPSTAANLAARGIHGITTDNPAALYFAVKGREHRD